MKQRTVNDVAVTNHPTNIGAAPPHFARLDAVQIEHRPFQRDQMPTVVAHHALGFARRAGGVENIERIGREHGYAIGDFIGCQRLISQLGPVMIAA